MSDQTPLRTQDLPNAVSTDGSNPFAYHSMAVRVPSIIQDTISRNSDYPLHVKDALAELHDDIVGNASLRLFEAPAPDYELWSTPFAMKSNETWLGTEWLFAEMLVYRLIVDITQYWTTLRDPFAPFKQEELDSDTLWNALSVALEKTADREERLAQCLTHALWGNRMDLSLKQAASLGTDAKDEHLLTNDIPLVVNDLTSKEPGVIHIIMDNAGTEQALDLVLADHLLSENFARRVFLHVKMQPVLVSDAIVADVHTLLGYMDRHNSETGTLAQRIRSFIHTGRLTIVPDFYWNTAGRLWELPTRIHDPFQNTALVISKGDLNYRRATNDALWPASASLADAIGNFPAPLLALRTLKSETLVGVSQEKQTFLDENGEPNWRTSGAYGIAQFAPLNN